ncbi:hypothetical protein BDR22DRAFT_697049 [Usnea florida]
MRQGMLYYTLPFDLQGRITPEFRRVPNSTEGNCHAPNTTPVSPWLEVLHMLFCSDPVSGDPTSNHPSLGGLHLINADLDDTLRRTRVAERVLRLLLHSKSFRPKAPRLELGTRTFCGFRPPISTGCDNTVVRMRDKRLDVCDISSLNSL